MSPLRAIVVNYVLDADIANVLTEVLDERIVRPMKAEIDSLRMALAAREAELAETANAFIPR